MEVNTYSILSIIIALNSKTLLNLIPYSVSKAMDVRNPHPDWVATNLVVEGNIEVVGDDPNWIGEPSRITTKFVVAHLDLSSTVSHPVKVVKKCFFTSEAMTTTWNQYFWNPQMKK